MKFSFFRFQKTELQVNCSIAIETVEYIKSVVNDPRPSFDIDLVPPYFTAQLRSTINAAMRLCVQCNFNPEKGGSPKERNREFLMVIKYMPTALKNAVYFKLASWLLNYLDSGKRKEYHYDKLVQDMYIKKKKMKVA